MGIGQLYVDAATQLGWEIETVDIAPDKGATYTEIPTDKEYDLAIICTPNFLHKECLDKALVVSKRVLVEKPGLQTRELWNEYVQHHPARVFMVKNNCYRDLFYGMGLNFENIAFISINWINKDRVPKPGSWFTNKELAFGGVSRDLLPHLIQVAIALTRYDLKNLEFIEGHKEQRYTLDDIESSSYGTIDKGGVYNVDDQCQANFMYKHVAVGCNAAWKSDVEKDVVEWEICFLGDLS